MSAILYPIAGTAQEALTAPRGRSAREREAEARAGEPVRFVREFVGPVFKSQDEGFDAHAGRLDDMRPGARISIAPQDRFCELKPLAQRGRLPFSRSHTAWRLSIGYWKVGQEAAAQPDLPQARKTRRDRKGEPPDAGALEALAHQPLLPIVPQKALDMGLFEVRMPEAPDRLMPDE